MDMIILLAVFVALLALAYVTYRNIHNLDSRLRRIEDILKNAQVVAEPVHTEQTDSSPKTDNPRSTDEATEVHEVPINQSTHDTTNGETFEPSPYANRYGKGMHDSFNDGVPGWGGEGPSAVPQKITVEKVSHDDTLQQSSSQGDAVNTTVKKVDVLPGDDMADDGDVDDDDDDSTGEISDDDVDSDGINVDDILQDMERDVEVDNVVGGGDTDGTSIPTRNAIIRAKVPELRRVLREAGINIPSGAKKADLIALVETHEITLSEQQSGEVDTHAEDDDEE